MPELVLQNKPAMIRYLCFREPLHYPVSDCPQGPIPDYSLIAKQVNPQWISAKLRTIAADDWSEKSILCKGKVRPANSMT